MYKSELLKRADARWEQVKELQQLGLICDNGEFVPSVHYPPITQYPPMTPDELYKTYTLPKDGLLDLYFHFPFCKQHCVFCHYPGKIGPQLKEKERYINYLKREIEIYMNRFELEKIVPRSILVGGGTPTYLTAMQLESFLSFLNEKADISRCTQFNYDVDPETLIGPEGRERLRIMKEYGVTRLTIGVQSLDDMVLKCMNRPHNAAEAIESVYNSKEFGFDVNIEFIYGHPGETYDNWIDVMEKAVTLPVDEIQLYRLKVLAYGDRQGDIINLKTPGFEETMKMKQIAIDILGENGFLENLRRVFTRSKKHISHYAYNQCCNLYDQVGFGITGFSSYRDRFGLNPYKFTEYYNAIDKGELPSNRGYVRDTEQQLRWSIILPLKNMDVRKKKFEKMNGLPFGSVFKNKVENLKKFGLIEENEHVVRLTELGSFVADEVAEQFNAPEFIPFPRERYAEGPLNPYLANELFDDKDLLHGTGVARKSYGREEILRLLLSRGQEQQSLFAEAQHARGSNRLAIRGVIEISNVCVKNCDYCAMRCQNAQLNRYSLTAEDILEASGAITGAGIPTVFLQSGQNPKCDSLLEQVIPEIIRAMQCDVLLCVGEKDKGVYERYKSLGVSSYILKFECSNKALFRSITSSELADRLACIKNVKAAGLKLGTGSIIGLPGQDINDIVNDILLAAALKPDFVSVSPFIPNKNTPFENLPHAELDLTLNAIAVLRLMLPHTLIPTVSALEYIQPAGQTAGLNAGANVITVNFTPDRRRDQYSIYNNDRFIVSLEHAWNVAEQAGMKLDIEKVVM